MKVEHEVGAPSQGSPNKGGLADKEVVEPNRACKVDTSDMGIDTRSKTPVAAQKISQALASP